MTDDYNVLFEQLKEYVASHTVEEMLYAGLQHFFNINEGTTIEDLLLKYNDETFNELGKPLSYFHENMTDISQNFCEYEKIYSQINEAKSKKVFTHMLAAKVYMDISHVREAYDTEDVYFDLTIWNCLSDETYVDCGGYTGDTALSFICHCPTYKKIYVLEPLEETELICQRNLEWFLSEGVTSVIRRAAYDRDTVLSFTKNNGTGDSCIDEKGDIQISAGALDEIIKEPISFIKMDIEGSEKAALEGARQHIETESPKMAVCVYHLKDDFWKIPQTILDINPGYDFILRQHRPDEYTETVLYAIPQISQKKTPSNLSVGTKYDRLKNALTNIRIIPTEEFNNLMENIKDKAWYLYQIRMHNEEISRLLKHQDYLNNSIETSQLQHQEQEDQLADLKEWIQKLEDAKTYLENQLTNYMEEAKSLNSLLTEQKRWSEQLQEGKEYLEKQSLEKSTEIDNLQKALAEQRLWSEQLQSGKDYLEDVFNKKVAEASAAKQDALQAETQLASVENELAKTKYKLSKLLDDSTIRKIIKFKKIEF